MCFCQLLIATHLKHRRGGNACFAPREEGEGLVVIPPLLRLQAK